MAVGVLGRALALLLLPMQGRFYVQLPVELRAEGDALAEAMNASAGNVRAVLVAERVTAEDPEWVVPPEDLLAWRTAEDRTFILMGSSVEPDSSFATSAVPFLTNAFPGGGGGVCTPEMLARATVTEALLPLVGQTPVVDAFARTAPWVMDLLGAGLQESPRATRGWGERLLEVWASLSSDLEAAATAAVAVGTRLSEWHAWELIRFAGFPRPLFGSAPDALPPRPEEVDGAKLQRAAKAWQKFIDEYVRVGEVATILDRLAASSSIPGTPRWRTLDWQGAARAAQRFASSAPEIGRSLFSTSLPRLADPLDEWMSVTLDDLEAALASSPDDPVLLPEAKLLSLGNGRCLLDTRQAFAGYSPKPSNDKINLSGLSVNVQNLGRELALSGVEPPVNGTLVLAVKVSVTPKTAITLAVAESGVEVSGQNLRISLVGELTVGSRAKKAVRWAPKRRLKIVLELQDLVEGELQPSRTIELNTTLMVPSPYWPSVFAPELDDVPVSPAADVLFEPAASAFTPGESPDLLVQRAGNGSLVAYDGRWNPTLGEFHAPSVFLYSDDVTLQPLGGFDGSGTVRLLDEAVVRIPQDEGLEATVIRVGDDRPLPTNPLRRTERDEALWEPSREARESPLGRYQTWVARSFGEEVDASSPSSVDSLFQLVMPSGLAEFPRELSFTRLPTAVTGAEGPWPGLGEGPSEELTLTRAWSAFTHAAAKVARAGLRAAVPDWLSSMDLTNVGAGLVRSYLHAHRALVEAARNERDKFWARYPYSVVLVDGSRGPEKGTLQAIFLSPMHPVRLGWLYSAQLHATAFGPNSKLLGLVDGWNLPASGEAPGPGGIAMRLVALPLDPGKDGDTLPWGALVPTSQHGIIRPPLFGAGARLPWGGRSGLNERVVGQALDDYLAAHPFLSSLQVELRSAVDAPRSGEIDRALLSWAAKRHADLGGSLRVLDSRRRLGEAPTRDSLIERIDGAPEGRFSWVVRNAEEPLPGPVDVAFVENAAPFTFVVQGRDEAPVPPLPVRRYPVGEQAPDSVDYHQAGRTDDLLGLHGLLQVVEPPSAATRVVTTEGSIQAEAEVRWEIIGDINLEPSQMARVARAGGSKQLWEWRPGWLSEQDRQSASPGAHYVLAKSPRSLVAALNRNVGLSETQALELLAELGTRGIGLATLRRPGSTQEGEAVGLFFAARILMGFNGSSVPPSWLGDNCYAGLIPLDPIQGVVSSLSDSPSADSRADLALVILSVPADGHTHVKIVPIECKQRGSRDVTASIPSESERRAAAMQASSSSFALRTFQEQVPATDGRDGLVLAAGRLQALATLVDLAMKFGPGEAPIEVRARAVQDILNGTACFEVGAGMVVWSLSGTGGSGVDPIMAEERSGGVIELLLAPAAIEPLLWAGHSPDTLITRLRSYLDAFLAPRLAPTDSLPLAPNLSDRLAVALDLDHPTEADPALDESHDPNRAPESEAGFVPEFVPDSSVAEEGPTAAGETSVSGDATQVEEATSAGAETSSLQSRSAEKPSELSEDNVTRPEGPTPPEPTPAIFVGAEDSTRFTIIGKTAAGGQVVALDLDQPKAIGVFGYMGSGKSYLLGTIMEGAAGALPGLNRLRNPLSVVVFNYRRNASDRFELSSLSMANQDSSDVRRLDQEYGAFPAGVPEVHVLCLPGELAARRDEYEGATASELYFKPSTLDVEDWELLMGEPGSDAVFARTIRTSLRELRHRGQITVEGVRAELAERLQKGSLSAAELRLEAVDKIVSEQRGIDFGSALASGRVLVIDLRQPMFNRDDAMKLILVCANQIAKQRTPFNKLVVFDEAHEYMTEEFGERFDARIRYMRHEGSSYIFASQDVGSVPVEVRRHLGTNFVFSLETRDNISDMIKAAPELSGVSLQHVEAGTCYVTSSRSTGNLFRVPRLVRVRPRTSMHGGKSRIFDAPE